MNNKSIVNKAISNTFFLYARMIIMVLSGLIATRMVLKALGQVDYGIFILVSGVVISLGFLTSAISNSSIRYIAVGLGKDENDYFRKTFNTIVLIHILIGIFAMAFIELTGLLLFRFILEIPTARLFASKIVFHFMALSTFVIVISAPYEALISSKEDFLALSIIDSIGAFLKLLAAYLLFYIENDRLIIFGALSFLIQLLLRLTKQLVTRIRYKESKISLYKYASKKLGKEVLSFTGWNILGSLTYVSSTQLTDIIINKFFGVRLNSASGVAKQASGQISAVSINLTRALLPQIMKSEGGGDRKRMLRLTMISSKFSVFVISLIAIPIIFNAKFLLELWLDKVPDYAVIFVQLLLLTNIFEKFTYQLTDSLRAVGDIKQFQLTESIVIMSGIPLSIFFYFLGFPPPALFVINMILLIFVSYFRLYYSRKHANLNIREYLLKVFLKSFKTLLLPFSIYILMISFIEEGLLRFVLSTTVFLGLYVLSILFFGLEEYEKAVIYGFIQQIKQRIQAILKKDTKPLDQ